MLQVKILHGQLQVVTKSAPNNHQTLCFMSEILSLVKISGSRSAVQLFSSSEGSCHDLVWRTDKPKFQILYSSVLHLCFNNDLLWQ